MANVRSVNFYDLCRICTATTEQKIDIFSTEGKTKNLWAKINECLALNVDEKDRLPKVLCPQCVQDLDKYTAFRNICRNSQAMLNSCLNTASAQNGGKVMIKDILSATGKSLSVLNNSPNALNSQSTNNAENLPNLTNHNLNHTIAPQLQQSPTQQQQQQLFTIQSGNVISQAVVNPLTASGVLPKQDFLNSIMQAVGIQSDQLKVEKPQAIPQYTLTVDNSTVQQQAPSEQNSLSTTHKDKDAKNNSLEEFLKMKPNIKVTPISKKQQQQQEQDQQQQLQQQQQIQQQQQLQQQHEQQQQQNQLVQFQLQQLIQQQLQQQQLQQQLQLLTSQLQPQQITITAPTMQHQPTTILQSTAFATENNLNDNNDDTQPPKSKNPKLNFVLTPPNQATNPTLNATLPQLTTSTAAQSATQPTTPQIQLQFQPTLTPQTLQLQQTQQQQQHNAATAALLSNLAPLLQPQTQLSAALQTQALATATQNTGANMLSPNKCYLPITIKDESTDQQFVAHIDAKNFLLPTTYQLQMKLQPQIATADGQPIMQLAPTSIPATLQLAPQAISANQTFQAAATVAAFNNNSILPTQLLQQQQNQPLQTTHPAQQQAHQSIGNTSVSRQQPQTLVSQQSQPLPSSPSGSQKQTQISHLPRNAQITSQQVLTTGNKKVSSPTSSNTKKTTETTTTNETEKQTPNSTQSVKVGSDTRHVIKQQKYMISQQPGSNTIEITPTTSFTQQIMRQVQQQQQQKQKLIQQNSIEPASSTTVTTQHGGITVQRITTKINSTTTSAANGTNENSPQSAKQSTITPVQQPAKLETSPILSKLPTLNKQNITISRISPQSQQQQQTKTQFQQATTQPKVGQQTNKLQTAPTTPTEAAGEQNKQQTTPTKIQQQERGKPSTHQKTQILSNIPNTTLRISPIKKIVKKLPPQTTSLTNSNQQQQSGNQAGTQKLLTSTATSATQFQYFADLTSVLPISSTDKPEVAADTKASIPTSPSTVPSASVNSDQPQNRLKCGECGRNFKKKEHLTQHVKLHTGERPFKCSENGCTKAFHRKEHLLRHLVSHTGKKMFECDICHKPFSRKDNLSKHRRIHTDSNDHNYFCRICNKLFVVKALYEQHKMMHLNKGIIGEDKKTANEIPAKNANLNQSNNNNTTNQTQYQVQTQPQPQQQKSISQTQQIAQQQQQTQQQLTLVQQQIQQLQQQNQAQSQQIMHLQLPTSIVTTQDLAGNTITITQANDQQANNLKTLTLGGGNHHDTTVLNLPTSLANFVQLSQAQFVNATTAQIMGLKIEK